MEMNSYLREDQYQMAMLIKDKIQTLKLIEIWQDIMDKIMKMK
jgi:hypothetical protein